MGDSSVEGKSDTFRANAHLSDLGCQLRWSTQHSLEVYSRESEIAGSFSDVDSSAARPD
jgi:hypothetical protein